MIKFGRVSLRALEQTDIQRVFTWINDPDVCKFLISHSPQSLDGETNWIKSLQADYFQRTPANVVYAIETQEAHIVVHIGNVGLHKIDWKNRNAELGILIGNKNFQKKGFGRETIKAILRHGFDELGLHKVSLSVFKDNEVAMKCYIACGFVIEGQSREAFWRDGKWQDLIHMSILDYEFAKKC